MSAEKQEPVSVEDSISQAFDEVEQAHENEEPAKEEKPSGRDDTGKFSKTVKEPEEPEKKDAPAEEVKTVKTEKLDDAPASWSGAVKSKWKDLPPEIKSEISKRENDVHQMMTRHDGELNLGREMKEAFQPYMAMINANRMTPAAAVKDLLSSVYVLKTGTPMDKMNIMRSIATQYGVDMRQVAQAPTAPQGPQDPYLRQMMEDMNGLKKTVNQQMGLHEQQEAVKVNAEIQAFAANPKNAYFEQVRPKMASMFGAGQVKDLQEAYDAACWSDPTIRASLIASQEKEAAEKRKAEVSKKKNAAPSVTGSPGVSAPRSTSPSKNKSVEDELREVFDDLTGSKI